jgi:hypothetical protein
MLDKLSVTRMVNVVTVSCVTNVGTPYIKPSESINMPGGNVPLSKAYCTDVAGNTAVADNCIAIII